MANRIVKRLDTSTPTNQLYHYGILGQKWGVRRFQNYDGKLIKDGKANKALSDKPDIIKAGDHVYRISMNKKEIDRGQTFIFSDEKDADKLAQKMLEINPKNKLYKLDLKAKVDMIGPSEKQRVENFIELYKNESVKTSVDYLKSFFPTKGINLVDIDGDDSMTAYRAYTIMVSKNIDGMRNSAHQNAPTGATSIVRDDYMRGFTNWGSNDKTPIESLDSAYIVYARSQALTTVSSTRVKKAKIKHSDDAVDILSDLFPGPMSEILEEIS